MSTIKSSDEHLTLNADGSSKDIKFQANGVEKASISSAGVISSDGGSTHADNVKAKFGTGNDLEIYHDGSHSYIKDEGTGNLILRTAGAAIELGGDGEALATFTKDGSVELYHNNVKKLETTSAGAKIQNRLEVETPNDSSTHLVQRLGSTAGSYGYVDLELVSPSSTAANLPRLDMQVGNTTVLSLQRGGRVVSQSNAHSWVNYNQSGTLSVQDSYNVSSVTDKGTGYAWVNFDTDHGNGSYAVCGMAGNHKRVTQDGAGLATGYVAIYTSQAGQTATTDESRVFVITFGDSA